jgi:hypothetical protein
LYSRGREELLITIKSGKEPIFDNPPQPFSSPYVIAMSAKLLIKFRYGKLSTMSESVPPASPSAKDAELVSNLLS